MIQFAHFEADDPLSIGRKGPRANTFLDQRFGLATLYGNSLDRLIVSAVGVKHPLAIPRTFRFALVGPEGQLLYIGSAGVHAPKVHSHFAGAARGAEYKVLPSAAGGDLVGNVLRIG